MATKSSIRTRLRMAGITALCLMLCSFPMPSQVLTARPADRVITQRPNVQVNQPTPADRIITGTQSDPPVVAGTPALQRIVDRPVRPMWIICGALGQSCCKAPDSASTALGPLVACHDGMGCDLATNTCVQPCGGPGQACCDGPGTRAVKWTADGRVYSPNSFNMREMCDGGACDTASHRCFQCGTTDGGPCCPPDAAQATARCFGHNMSCEFTNDRATAGVCRVCGTRLKPPCELSGCDAGLKIRNGLCDICGAEAQAPCDAGCDRGLSPAQGLCRRCGAAGQIPCDRGCNAGTRPINGICTSCGANGQPPCEQGCQHGLTPIAGVCRPCGADGQRPCGARCNYPLKVAQGWCRNCGAEGQVACDAGCNAWLTPINGVCSRPQEPPSQQCAVLNQACVPNTQSGTHCCGQGNPPLLCVWQTCKACVPHGQTCQLGGTQICCTYGESCVLDTETGNAVCDLPDP
ncbi:MAG: hypothetical protein HOQ32_00290 [Lysobacter sp.]|nr:hypothetical protein [Lysobacter sp.]